MDFTTKPPTPAGPFSKKNMTLTNVKPEVPPKGVTYFQRLCKLVGIQHPQRLVLTSSQFVISCGTVTVDLHQKKVLLIRSRKTGDVLLPKGRKNVGESLESAAVRETWEETGYRVALLPLAVHTMATQDGHSDVKRDLLVTEPMAMSQRANADGVLKVILWFAAQGDSTAVSEERVTPDDEDFEAFWAAFDAVEDRLSFQEDRLVAKEIIDKAVNDGHVVKA